MKPHEQDWETDDWYNGVHEKTTGAYVAHARRGVGDDPVSSFSMAQFIAAAPDMARALLAIRARMKHAARGMPGSDRSPEAVLRCESIPIPSTVLAECLAALRKAGVLT